MKNQLEVDYLDGKIDKFFVTGPEECDIQDGVAIICTVEGMVMRLNWNTIRKIGYYPAPRSKKEPEADLPFEETSGALKQS